MISRVVWWLRRLVGLGAIPLVLACGGSDADSQDMRVDEDAAIDTTPAGTAAPPSLPGVAGDIRRQSTVVLREWSVESASDALPAGEITFQVMNTGTQAHRLAVEGPAAFVRSDSIDSGATLAVSVALSPGTYRLYCPDESDGISHSERGMSIPFVVR